MLRKTSYSTAVWLNVSKLFMVWSHDPTLDLGARVHCWVEGVDLLQNEANGVLPDGGNVRLKLKNLGVGFC